MLANASENLVPESEKTISMNEVLYLVLCLISKKQIPRFNLKSSLKIYAFNKCGTIMFVPPFLSIGRGRNYYWPQAVIEMLKSHTLHFPVSSFYSISVDLFQI